MEKQIWKDIPGCKGEYQISTQGEIMSFKRYSYGIKVKLLSNKIKGKYTSVNINKDGEYNMFYIHELVAITFLGYKKIDRKLCINHINGEKSDNRLENIEVVTYSYNVKDGFNRGRKGMNKFLKMRELGVEYSVKVKEVHKNKVIKTIYQYDLNMNFIKSYCSSVAAEKELGIRSNDIRTHISCKTKKCNGFIFKHELIEKTEVYNEN